MPDKKNKRSATSVAAPRRLVLLDAHAIIHRAYHALPDFSSSKGEPTGALYGLSTMLIRIIADLKPHAVVACYDLPKPTYRHEAYEGYKAGRAKTDDALADQLARSREVFAAFSIPCLSAEGFEADDVLGTIVEKVRAVPGIETIIASGDMDTLQLVRGIDVKVFTLRKGISDTVMYDEAGVVARFGFPPARIPDYKGLAGDPSDNITGVPGIGDKTATTLVKAYGTVDNIYKELGKLGVEAFASAAGVTPRIAKLLAEHEEEARFSTMLATIRRDAPVEFSMPEVPYKETIDLSKVSEMCARFEFRTLFARFKSSLGIASDEASAGEASAEVVDPDDLAKTSLALWVVDSNISNPSLPDVLAFARTEKYAEAKKAVFAALDERKGRFVFEEIELPLMPIIAAMERRGVLIDTAYLATLGRAYTEALHAVEGKIYGYAGTEFNISSPKQLGEILYDKLDLAAGARIKKTDGGARSTREAELVKLSGAHPIIPAVLEYRELSKLIGTYIEPLPRLADSAGRIHAHFMQAGTTTGRMSSESPNLQNIPIRSEHGKNIRRAFTAPRGKKLLALDYSQMELRLAAMLSGDEKYIAVFQGGKDIHTAVAAKVFRKDEKDITPDERRAAKGINFGILYGMGANALKEALSQGGEKVPLKDAQKFLADYFDTFSGLAAYLDETKASAARRGYTETLFGRRRYLDGLASRIPYIRAAAERMAINAPIQGTEADVVKIAMARAERAIASAGLSERAALILQVHDELVYEVDEGFEAETAAAIKSVMESIIPAEQSRGVSLPVEASAGRNWEDLEDLPLDAK